MQQRTSPPSSPSTPPHHATNDRHVLIVGVGVIGLTIGVALLAKGYRITLVARDLPLDHQSIHHASPWAGAMWMPFEVRWPDAPCARWECDTFAVWQASKAFNATGKCPLPSMDDQVLTLVPARRITDDPQQLHQDHWQRPWWSKVVHDFHLDGLEQRFATFCLHPTRYCQVLLDTLLADSRVTVHRDAVESLHQAHQQFGDRCDVVINATGLGARFLTDVQDRDVHPVRGQTVLIKCDPTTAASLGQMSILACPPPASETAAQEERRRAGQLSYVIPRAHSNEILLGGTAEPGCYSTQTDLGQVGRILEQAMQLEPALARIACDGDWISGCAPPTCQVLHCGVGLRPDRKGGPRVDVQHDLLPNGVPVVHAYGFGKVGYQVSWGVAMDVMAMVQQCWDRENSM